MEKLLVPLLCGLLLGCGKPGPATNETTNTITLAPPARGVQLAIGPFDVPPGSEVQICQTMEMPNDEPMAVNRIEMQKLTGSHHTILFASDDDTIPDQVFMCWGTVNFDTWKFIVDSQSEHFDWTLPAGKTYTFKPHQKVMIQAHYQNATFTHSPYGGAVAINLYATDIPPPEDVVNIAHGMFTVNRRIDIPPNTRGITFSRDCVFTDAAYVFGIYGHFHSRGTLFTVDHYGVPVNEGNPNEARSLYGRIYESRDWANMTFERSPSADLPGDGVNGYYVGEGESLRFSCTYDNTTENEIVFGSHADVQEHCNLFFHYSMFPMRGSKPVPAGTELSCLNGGGVW